MAFQGTLFIQGREYNVLECDYEFNQPIDNNYKPSAYTAGGLINFTLDAVNEEDTLFHEWMMSISEVKEGYFILPTKKDTTEKMKRVNFKHAHCIRLYEYFNNRSGEEMIMKVTLSAAFINFGGKAEFHNRELKKK